MNDDRQLLPCPKCDQQALVYDGMLIWRSGTRPPHAWARKDVVFTLNANYERERCYHCAGCGTEFFEDMETDWVHLYEEGDGRYDYDPTTGTWARQR